MNKTQGNVIVDEIQVGDIHYEFQGGRGSRFMVITKPIRDVDGQWSWISKNLKKAYGIILGVLRDSTGQGCDLR